MQRISYPQPDRSRHARKSNRRFFMTCGALALTVVACGQQAQDPRGERSATGQDMRTSNRQGAEKNNKPDTGNGAAITAPPPLPVPEDESISAGQPSPEFQALDTDHDGQIRTDEANENPRLSKNFKKFDRDGDEQLNPTEFAAFKKAKTVSQKIIGKMQPRGAQSNAGKKNANRASR